jgi:hypothetical protein
VHTNLANISEAIKDAAKAQWPEGEDGDRLVCRFLRLSGDVVEGDVDAWDKTTDELVELLRELGIITTRQYARFADENATARRLSQSIVPYPREVCSMISRHTLKESTNRRRMPRLIMIVLNTLRW